MQQGRREPSPRPESFAVGDYIVVAVLVALGVLFLMLPLAALGVALESFGVIPDLPPSRAVAGAPIAFAVAFTPIGVKCYERRQIKKWRGDEVTRERRRKDDIRRAARKLAEWDSKREPRSSLAASLRDDDPKPACFSLVAALRKYDLTMEDLDEGDDALFVMVYRDALSEIAREKIVAARESVEKNARLARRTARLNEPRNEVAVIAAEVAHANKSLEEGFDELLAQADR